MAIFAGIYVTFIFCFPLYAQAFDPEQELASAATDGNIPAVNKLLIKGTSPEGRFRGDSALTGAAKNGHIQVIRILLSKGADREGRSHGSLRGLAACAGGGDGDPSYGGSSRRQHVRG